ncbi:MAG: hypothetical protein ACYC7J_13490 [Syntrophales bacterium]
MTSVNHLSELIADPPAIVIDERQKLFFYRGVPIPLRPVSFSPVGDFRKAWATACMKIGIPGLLFHDRGEALCATWCGPGSRSGWR